MLAGRFEYGTLFADTVLRDRALPHNAAVSREWPLIAAAATRIAARLELAAHRASIQMFDPTSLTATFEKKRCRRSPLRVPR